MRKISETKNEKIESKKKEKFDEVFFLYGERDGKSLRLDIISAIARGGMTKRKSKRIRIENFPFLLHVGFSVDVVVST